MIEKIITIIFTFITLIVILSLSSLVLAFPVMWLWNWIITGLFNLCSINYWQAFGLLILSGILFKSTVNVKQ